MKSVSQRRPRGRAHAHGKSTHLTRSTRRLRFGGVLACLAALLGGLLISTPTASADSKVPTPGTVFSDSELAAAVELINQKIYVAREKTTATTLQRSLGAQAGGLAKNPLALHSLTVEANRVDGVAKNLYDDGRISITAVKAAVSGVTVENGVRFVTLHIARTLDDGQVWEELQPFAVIDAPIGGLKSGQFFSVDGEAVQYDEVPKELLDFDNVPNFDPAEFTDEKAPAPSVIDSEIVEPSSIEPLGKEDAPGGIEAKALSAANRTKVKNYALKYALSPNSSYHLWSQDCTNFVSQALKAGGWSHDLGWYRSDGNWWYTGNPVIKASWTWAGAPNFFRFARIESGRATGWSNVYSLRVGDILQYANSTNYNNMVHSMVTTGHSNGVPLLSYHTSNTKNKPFTSINTSGRTWWAHKV